ncbi:MAG: OmpA family protein [Candidatus Omnitrophota bacterium]
MRAKKYLLSGVSAVIVLNLMLSGCAVNFYKQSPRSKQKIQDLQAKIDDLEKQRNEERERFEEVKKMLANKLQDQIADNQISLEMDDRGLVIILSDNVLFDSGKADVKTNAMPILDKVADIISSKVPDKNIGVSGHTDNVPIKYSKWESNWELSSKRATNVLHYLVKQGVSPNRLSATGYGEHRPVASNATLEGRGKNRRVEIVILPEFEEKREDIRGVADDNFVK